MLNSSPTRRPFAVQKSEAECSYFGGTRSFRHVQPVGFRGLEESGQ